MIDRVLNTYSRQMEQFLGSYFHQPEGLVEVAPIGFQGEDEPAKLVISLLGMERENVQGMSTAAKVGTGKIYGLSLPPVYMNLHVVIAAVFPNKRYRESLSILTQAIAFVQANPYFVVHPQGRFTVELMNTSWQDLSNIWSGIGGHYYPSVVCKIRRLTFSANEISRAVSDLGGLDASVE